MTPPDDEFYIGYEPVLPPAMRRRLRRAGTVAAVTIVGATLAVLLAHGRLAPSRFDFGRPQAIAGVLERRPYPSITTRDGHALLVGRGKHAADGSLATVANGPVRLRGTAIARDGHTMYEVVPGSAEIDQPPAPALLSSADEHDEIGDVTLAGEIVDSKCHLGVMSPGEGVVHRDCASLCLRGGIPPMLAVRDGAGRSVLVLLVSRDGRAMSEALSPLAGVPVEVRGRLIRDERGLVLAADIGDYQRTTR